MADRLEMARLRATHGLAARSPANSLRRLGVVLVIDDDRDIAFLVQEVLTDEGYVAAVLATINSATIQEAVDRLEPDCILLDSAPGLGYGASWDLARQLHFRKRRIPVVMFSAYLGATQEADANVSKRSLAADFVAVLAKPFELSDLLAAVQKAVETTY